MPYTESAARIGLGTELRLGLNDVNPVGSPPILTETFQLIGEITDISKTGAKADTVSVYNMQSPDGFDEFISGKRDAGEVSFTVNLQFGDDSQSLLTNLFTSGERRNWRIVVPAAPDEEASPGWYAFKAIVTGYGDSNFTPDKQIAVSAKLKISGTYVFVPA